MTVRSPYFTLLVASYGARRRLLLARGARLRASSVGALRVLGEVERRRDALGGAPRDRPVDLLVRARPGAGGRAQPVGGAAPQAAREVAQVGRLLP
jgi:hypothetical protein